MVNKNRYSAKEKLSISLHANMNFAEHNSGIDFDFQEVGIPIIKLNIWGLLIMGNCAKQTGSASIDLHLSSLMPSKYVGL